MKKLIPLILVFMLLFNTVAFALPMNPVINVVGPDIYITPYPTEVEYMLNTYFSGHKAAFNAAAYAIMVAGKVPTTNLTQQSLGCTIYYGNYPFSINGGGEAPSEFIFKATGAYFGAYVGLNSNNAILWSGGTSNTANSQYPVLVTGGELGANNVARTVYARGGALINNTGLTLHMSAMPTYPGTIQIFIPTEGSTVTNTDSLISMGSDQPYIGFELWDVDANKMVFKEDSQRNPILFNRSQINVGDDYSYSIVLKDLPTQNNKTYKIKVTGADIENGALVQKTAVTERTFIYDAAAEAFVRIDGVEESRLYTNNAKFTVTKSGFYYLTTLDIKLNGQNIGALPSKGALTSETIDLFSLGMGIDPREIGVNVLTVVNRQTNTILTSVQFYLKTPFDETTGANSDTFSNDPSVGGYTDPLTGQVTTPPTSSGYNYTLGGTPPVPPGANATIFDYAKYVVDVVRFVFKFIGDAIGAMVGGASSVGLAISKFLSFLPQPIPSVIVMALVVSVIASVIKLIFKR